MQRTPSGSTERTISSSTFLPLRSSSVSSSYALSKWSSMARLLRPVTKIISVMPAAAASSTAYWMSGLSTIGSISFGLALVTGRKRLPRPATGKTAFLSLTPMRLEVLQHGDEFFFLEYPDPERTRLVELGSGILAGNHVVRLLRHRAGHLVSLRFDRRARFVAAHARESTSQDESLGCAVATSRRWFAFRPGYAGLHQRLDHAPVVRFVQELPHRAGDHRSHVGDLQQALLGGFEQRRQVAEVADPEGVDEPLEGGLPGALERRQQVGGRLLGHALELRQVLQAEPVQVCWRMDQALVDQLV